MIIQTWNDLKASKLRVFNGVLYWKIIIFKSPNLTYLINQHSKLQKQTSNSVKVLKFQFYQDVSFNGLIYASFDKKKINIFISTKSENHLCWRSCQRIIQNSCISTEISIFKMKNNEHCPRRLVNNSNKPSQTQSNRSLFRTWVTHKS
jgi:hypothetical protein